MKMRSILACLIICLIPSLTFAADVLIGNFETGQVITELNMQYKGHTDYALYLYNPADTSSDGYVVLGASKAQTSGLFNNDWIKIPGVSADAPAMAWDPIALEMRLIVRGTDGAIWTSTINPSHTAAEYLFQYKGIVYVFVPRSGGVVSVFKRT